MTAEEAASYWRERALAAERKLAEREERMLKAMKTEYHRLCGEARAMQVSGA